MVNFEEILKELMKKNNLSPEKLAEDLNSFKVKNGKTITLTKSTIRNYITGKSTPKNIENVQVLADYFNVSIDYLLGFTDEPSVDINAKEIYKKYGLCEKALNNLSLLYSHRQIFKDTPKFNDVGTTIDTINFLLSEKMDNNNISILQLIDFYINTEPSKKYILALQEKGNVKLYDKTEKKSKFMSGKAFLSGDMLVEGILVEIINRLKKLKEGEK